MPQWTDFRDGALEAMKDGALNVVEETKQAFLLHFVEAGMPVIEQYANQFVAAVKEQAEGETGWTRIRDAFVIPLCVSIGMYVGRQIVETVMKQAGAAKTA